MAKACVLSDQYIILDPPYSPYTKLEWQQILKENNIFRICPNRLSYSVKHGVPSSLREEIWIFLSRCNLLEASNKPYCCYLEFPDIQIEKLIIKDIGRTFPSHPDFRSFESNGQQTLFRVLKAYSYYDQETNYCQGMNFIAALLIINLPEEKAFWTLVSIMFEKDWRRFYQEGTPRLNKIIPELTARIQAADFQIFHHLKTQGVEFSIFAKYFLTLFSCDGNIELGTRVLDIFLCKGIDALYEIIEISLIVDREKLLKMKYEDLYTYLTKSFFSSCLNIIQGNFLKFRSLEDEYTIL